MHRRQSWRPRRPRSPRMYTKNEQILDPQSDWNQAANDEPVFIVRANNWRAVLFLAAIVKAAGATEMCLNHMEEMKAFHEGNDIPF